VTDRTAIKRAFVAALLANLEQELATMRKAAKDAREAATHEAPLSALGMAAQVVTPQSPLGQALFGRAAGDVIEVRAKGATREMTIVDLW
jgi:hypothetical protein